MPTASPSPSTRWSAASTPRPKVLAPRKPQVACSSHTACRSHPHLIRTLATGARAEFDAFLGRVRRLVADLAAAPRAPLAAFDRVRRLLRDGVGSMEDENFCPALGYDIGAEGVLALQAGFEAAVRRIGALPRTRGVQTVRDLILAEIGSEGMGEQRVIPSFIDEVQAALTGSGAQPSPPSEKPDVPTERCDGFI